MEKSVEVQVLSHALKKNPHTREGFLVLFFFDFFFFTFFDEVVDEPHSARVLA